MRALCEQRIFSLFCGAKFRLCVSREFSPCFVFSDFIVAAERRQEESWICYPDRKLRKMEKEDKNTYRLTKNAAALPFRFLPHRPVTAGTQMGELQQKDYSRWFSSLYWLGEIPVTF